MNSKKDKKAAMPSFENIRSKLVPLLALTLLLFTTPSFSQDPSGTATGTIKDLGIDTVAASTDTTMNAVVSAVNTIGNADGHNKIAINIMWTLIAGFLVMFMQAGFALVETGFTQKKNVAHTMAMNFLIYVIGLLGFWICGFAFMFGGVGAVGALGGTPGLTHEFSIHLFGHDFGLWGNAGYFLTSRVYDVGIFTLFLFQLVFMDTTATIPTGAMAERWQFKSFVVYGFFISMFVLLRASLPRPRFDELMSWAQEQAHSHELSLTGNVRQLNCSP